MIGKKSVLLKFLPFSSIYSVKLKIIKYTYLLHRFAIDEQSRTTLEAKPLNKLSSHINNLLTDFEMQDFPLCF